MGFSMADSYGTGHFGPAISSSSTKTTASVPVGAAGLLLGVWAAKYAAARQLIQLLRQAMKLRFVRDPGGRVNSSKISYIKGFASSQQPIQI